MKVLSWARKQRGAVLSASLALVGLFLVGCQTDSSGDVGDSRSRVINETYSAERDLAPQPVKVPKK